MTGDGTKTYSYDPNGNRTNSGDSTTTGNELTTDGTWNYSYDLAGNETQKTNISTGEVWQYGYDNANRLVEADHKPSATGAVNERVMYQYDVLGNRIETTVDPDGTGQHDTVTKYANDLLGNVWADLSSSGSLLERRLYDDAVDALDARIDTSGIFWYLTDVVGSVRDILGSSGSLLDHRDYDLWGAITNETHPAYGDRYGWTGREYQAETNLQYNRARFYDPNTGRWMSQDPLGFDAGDSNLYRYVNNTPTDASDPSGDWAVGHHWVPVSVLTNSWFRNRMSMRAFDAGMGGYSGQTSPNHNFGTYGGVSHAKYNEVVASQLKLYMEWKGIGPRHKKTGEEMFELSERMRKGLNYYPGMQYAQ